MTREHKLMAGAALLVLVFIGAGLVLIDQSNRTMLANRAALSRALTQQFEMTHSVPPETTTPALIVTNVAQASPLLPQSATIIDVVADCGSSGDEVFVLSLSSSDPLVADGRSSRVVTLRTCDSRLVGRALNLIADGGHLNPPQVILPAPGDPAQVQYIAGLSAGEVVIAGVVSDGMTEYRSEVRLHLIGESVVLLGDFDQSVTTNPLAIPVELRLVNPATGADAIGEYVVRVYGDTHGRVMLAGGSPADSVDITFLGSRATGQAYYLPNAGETRGIVQAYLIGRSDVPPFEAVVFWNNLTERLLFSQNWLAEQRGEPRDLSFWYTPLEHPLCLLAVDASFRAIVPNRLRLRYEAGSMTPVFAISGVTASEGRWLNAGEQIPEATINEFSENCFTLTMPTDTAQQAGVLHLEAAAERARIHDDIYIFAHQGAFDLGMGAETLTLSLNQADMNITPALPGTLTLPANTALTVYRSEARSVAETVAYLVLWTDPALLDMERGTLRSSIQPITLFAGSVEQPNLTPVSLALQADSSVVLLDSRTASAGEWRRVALLVTIPDYLVPPATPIPFMTALPIDSPVAPTANTPLLAPSDLAVLPIEVSPSGSGNQGG